MPKRANFSRIIRKKKQPTAKKRGKQKNVKLLEKKVNLPKQASAKKRTSVMPAQKKAIVKKQDTLEREIHEFHTKPQAEREEASEDFDFTKITAQIKKKLATKHKTGFDETELEKAVAETEEKKQGAEKPIERAKTGIRGLDELIEGGFEKGSSILLVGSAGTGKTLFSLQFLYSGAKKYDEPGIFLSFEENRESLFKHSSAFGWDFKELERQNKFKIMEYKPHQVEKIMREGGGPIKDQIRAMGAKRLVIDSITSYGLLFRDEYKKRETILEFFEMLHKWGCTSIIISELPPKIAEVKEGSVGFLTDAIISLYYTKEEDKGVRVHSCEILKMRGTRHTNKLLALGFEADGLAIYPEVEVF